jgi:hypothetical protein
MQFKLSEIRTYLLCGLFNLPHTPKLNSYKNSVFVDVQFLINTRPKLTLFSTKHDVNAVDTKTASFHLLRLVEFVFPVSVAAGQNFHLIVEKSRARGWLRSLRSKWSAISSAPSKVSKKFLRGQTPFTSFILLRVLFGAKEKNVFRTRNKIDFAV